MNEIPLFYNSNCVLEIQLYVVDKREPSNILMLNNSKQRTTIVMSWSFGEFWQSRCTHLSRSSCKVRSQVRSSSERGIKRKVRITAVSPLALFLCLALNPQQPCRPLVQGSTVFSPLLEVSPIPVTLLNVSFAVRKVFSLM